MVFVFERKDDLRALITRPRGEAETLAAALAKRGIEAVIEPLMQIHFHTDEPVDLTDVQAVLCTSANGVRGACTGDGERHVPLFAVGDATAAQARAAGFSLVESAAGMPTISFGLRQTARSAAGCDYFDVAATSLPAVPPPRR